MRAIVWMSDSLSQALQQRLQAEIVSVRSAREFLSTPRDANTVSFVDNSTISQLAEPPPKDVVAICDGAFPVAVEWLATYPWLFHVVSAAMLQHPLGDDHLSNVMRTLTSDSRPQLLDWCRSIKGRRVRLALASKRVERLDRMNEFLVGNSVPTRTAQLLRDAAEELLTNAFYNAPVSAGAIDRPISRTRDVQLPDDYACEMVYASRSDLAIVGVRDPFGSLKRSRIVEVLVRCARSNMQVGVDETMGGAGLGLWRIFTVSSFTVISVVNSRRTETLVGIGKRTGPRPYSFHLFYRDSDKPRSWKSIEDTSSSSRNKSITLVPK